MLSKLLLLRTALAPAVWGTTYIATTALLPSDRPLLAGVLRAMPAGLILLLIVRRRPQGVWWYRSFVLGALNIGVFFPLLFIAAYRLPGGVAATLGAVQPLLVQTIAVRLVGERLRLGAVLAGLVGVVGVALLVLRSHIGLDTLGVVAALAGTCSMALGIVLTKRWSADVPPLASTAWQLLWGGLLMLPVLLLVEGVPVELSPKNLLGYGYLTLVGGVLAYSVWFAGIRLLPTVTSSFLGLLSPLVATLLGWILLAQSLTSGQVLGAALVIGALVVVIARPARQMHDPEAGGSDRLGVGTTAARPAVRRGGDRGGRSGPGEGRRGCSLR